MAYRQSVQATLILPVPCGDTRPDLLSVQAEITARTQDGLLPPAGPGAAPVQTDSS